MKKAVWCAALALCLSLLSACAETPVEETVPDADGLPPLVEDTAEEPKTDAVTEDTQETDAEAAGDAQLAEAQENVEEPVSKPAPQTSSTTGTSEPKAQLQSVSPGETFRLIDWNYDDENPVLLLAKDGGGLRDVYTLNVTGAVKVTADAGAEEGTYVPGERMEIVYDSVQETFPGQLSASSIRLLADGFDDRCLLYRRVLDNLWDVDEGLNDNVKQIGVDLFQTSLSLSEQAAVGYAFAASHEAEVLPATYEQLQERGLITGEPSGNSAQFWQWEDGCLFSIREKTQDVSWNLAGDGAESPSESELCFDAEKWRSSLGAYMLTDCVAYRKGNGHWGQYAVGSEMAA